MQAETLQQFEDGITLEDIREVLSEAGATS